VDLGTEVTQVAADFLATLAERDGVLVGVLETSDHPNLTPGRWMVFAGHYESANLAKRAATKAQKKYPGARPVYVIAPSRG